MNIRSIALQATVGTDSGVFDILVKANINRAEYLDLILNAVSKYKDNGLVVKLPAICTTMEDVETIIYPTSVINHLMENNINIEGDIEMSKEELVMDIACEISHMKKAGNDVSALELEMARLEKEVEEMNKEEEEVILEDAMTEDQEKAFDVFAKMMEQASETLVKEGGMSYIEKVLKGKDSEVYGKVLEALHEIAEERYKKSVGLFGKVDVKKVLKANKIFDAATNTEKAESKLLSKFNDKDTVLGKIKAIAVLIFKKVIAALKGLAIFTFDATTILGTAMCRLTYNTAKELIYAGKAIGVAFKKDVIDSVKNA